jgi:rubrerythrin
MKAGETRPARRQPTELYRRGGWELKRWDKAPKKGKEVLCRMCNTVWAAGRNRRSCPNCGASLNQWVLDLVIKDLARLDQ